MTLGDRLRSSLERMLEWRTSVGYANDTYRYTLGPFVDYVDGERPGDGPLTPDVVDGWLAHHHYPSANTQASFVACLRGLCRFLRFEGSEDFVPDERYTLTHVPFHPYLFTDCRTAHSQIQFQPSAAD